MSKLLFWGCSDPRVSDSYKAVAAATGAEAFFHPGIGDATSKGCIDLFRREYGRDVAVVFGPHAGCEIEPDDFENMLKASVAAYAFRRCGMDATVLWFSDRDQPLIIDRELTSEPLKAKLGRAIDNIDPSVWAYNHGVDVTAVAIGDSHRRLHRLDTLRLWARGIMEATQPAIVPVFRKFFTGHREVPVHFSREVSGLRQLKIADMLSTTWGLPIKPSFTS